MPRFACLLSMLHVWLCYRKINRSHAVEMIVQILNSRKGILNLKRIVNPPNAGFNSNRGKQNLGMSNEEIVHKLSDQKLERLSRVP